MSMSCLPMHGPSDCELCFAGCKRVEFGVSTKEAPDGSWEITLNPLAWGNPNPEILVLGFSKGSNQNEDLLEAIKYEAAFNKIAFKGWRDKVGKILAHAGVICVPPNGSFESEVNRIIKDKKGRYHFGSLVRCSAGRCNKKRHGNFSEFVKTDFGSKVAENCTKQFLGGLPPKTKLVILFGNSQPYISAVRKLVKTARPLPGNWRKVNDVAYCDGSVTFVHVIHFCAWDDTIRNWLGAQDGTSKNKGIMAQDAVMGALAR